MTIPTDELVAEAVRRFGSEAICATTNDPRDVRAAEAALLNACATGDDRISRVLFIHKGVVCVNLGTASKISLADILRGFIRG